MNENLNEYDEPTNQTEEPILNTDNGSLNHPKNSTAEFSQKSFWQQINDFFFGYDFFISYAWQDGRNYAVKLAEQLEARRFECFLDSKEYAGGDNWDLVGTRALKKTSLLILIGSPAAIESIPVLSEVQKYSRGERRLIPIDFEGTLPPIEAESGILAYIDPKILRIEEQKRNLPIGPSAEVVDRITSSFDLSTQDKRRTRWFASAALVFSLIAVLAVVFWVRATQQTKKAVYNEVSSLISLADASRNFGQIEESTLHFWRAYSKCSPDDPRRIQLLAQISQCSSRLTLPFYHKQGEQIESPLSLTHYKILKDTLLTSSDDGSIRFWNLQTGLQAREPLFHTKPVSSFSLDASSGKIVSLSGGYLFLWGQYGTLHKQVKVPEKIGGLERLEFSCDGKYLVGQNLDCQLWIIETTQFNLKDAQLIEVTRNNKFMDNLTWELTPDENFVATATNDPPVLSFISLENNAVQTLPGGWDRAMRLRFSPDGRSVSVLSNKKKTKYLYQIDLWKCDYVSTPNAHWSVEKTDPFLRVHENNCIAVDVLFGKENKLIVIFRNIKTEMDENFLGIWEKQNGRWSQKSSIKIPNFVQSIARTQLDEELFCMSSFNNPIKYNTTSKSFSEIKVFQPRYLSIKKNEGQSKRSLIENIKQKLEAAGFKKRNDFQFDDFLDYDQANQLILGWQRDSNRVLVWPIHENSPSFFNLHCDLKKEPWKLHFEQLDRVCVSAKANLFVTCSEDHTARLWDLKSGLPIGVFDHGFPIESCAIDPNGEYLSTAGGGVIYMWRLKEGTRLVPKFIYDTHDYVDSFSFDPSGKFFLTLTREGVVRVWVTKSFSQLGPPIGPVRPPSGGVEPIGQVRSAVFSSTHPVSIITITRHNEKIASHWPIVPPAQDDPERLQLSVELKTGLRVHPSTGLIQKLSYDERIKRYKVLKENPCDLRSWDELSEAELNELAKQDWYTPPLQKK